MPASEGKNKLFRMLDLERQLNCGESINIKKTALYYHVSERSIRRDIQDINEYLYQIGTDEGTSVCVEKNGEYRLTSKTATSFSDSEIFALSKVLLESRAFSKGEMNIVIDHLLTLCNNKKEVQSLIQNEWFYYLPLQHNKDMIDIIWKICSSVEKHKYVNASYQRQDGKIKNRRLTPKGIVFSEYYFYLVADIYGLEKAHSAAFRVDRFQKYEITDETYKWEHASRFQEGEYRKLIHFMYQGDLLHIRFKFWGDSAESVLDRIPTAEIVGHDGSKTIFKADVFDNGIMKWLLSQGEFLEVIEPQGLREKMIDSVKRLSLIYSG